jgi:hypothetical protein
VGEHNVLSRNSREDLSSWKESSPNPLSMMTGYEQMVDIFIERAAGALSRGRQLVTDGGTVMMKLEKLIAFDGARKLVGL